MLAEAGDVRGLVRDPSRAGHLVRRAARSSTGTSPTPPASPAHARAIDVAYYLVHAMAGGAGFQQREHDGPSTSPDAARTRGVERVVYLGGLGDGERLQAPAKPP